MENTLKNCPFCGNKAEYREGHEHSYIGGYSITVYVECTHCSAQMDYHYGTDCGKEITEKQCKDYLAEQWNNRVLTTPNANSLDKQN